MHLKFTLFLYNFCNYVFILTLRNANCSIHLFFGWKFFATLARKINKTRIFCHRSPFFWGKKCQNFEIFSVCRKCDYHFDCTFLISRQFVTLVLLFGEFYKRLSRINAKSILRLYKVTSENWKRKKKKKNPETSI
jgi:hypothetical protein